MPGDQSDGLEISSGDQSEDLPFVLFSEEDELLLSEPLLSDEPLLADAPLSDDAEEVEEPLAPLLADSPDGLSPDLSLDLSFDLSPAASADLLPERA